MRFPDRSRCWRDCHRADSRPEKNNTSPELAVHSPAVALIKVGSPLIRAIELQCKFSSRILLGTVFSVARNPKFQNKMSAIFRRSPHGRPAHYQPLRAELKEGRKAGVYALCPIADGHRFDRLYSYTGQTKFCQQSSQNHNVGPQPAWRGCARKGAPLLSNTTSVGPLPMSVIPL